MIESKDFKDISRKQIAPYLAEVANIFGGRAEEYITRKVFGKHLFELKHILKGCPGESPKVLDVGGGLGVNLITLRKINPLIETYLLDRFDEYEGVNSDENPMGSVEVGLKLLYKSGVKVFREDFWKANRLPFESGFFDVVSCFDVIEHFTTHPLIFLAEITRILKKDGLLVMCAPNLLSTARRSRIILGRHPYMHFDMWMCEKYDRYYGHFREYTRKEYKVLLERAGYKDIRTFMVSEPTRTKAINSYHHRQYSRFSLPALGLWIIYLIELIFPSLRTEVYCTARPSREEL